MDKRYLVASVEPIKNKMLLILKGEQEEVQLVVCNECYYTNLVKLDQTIDQAYLDRIRSCDLYFQIMEKGLGYLKKKDYSVSDFKKALMNKFNNEAAVNNVVEQVIKMKYLDDNKFIEAIIEKGIAKHYSQARINEQLKQSGIDHAQDIVKAALAEVEFENGVAEAKVYLKKNKNKGIQKIKTSIYSRLNYLGYEGELIEKILNSLKISLNQDSD
jgi:SOS response regulatory protein OraA/RecX